MFVDGGKWKIKVLFVVRIIPKPFTDLQDVSIHGAHTKHLMTKYTMQRTAYHIF